MIKYRKQCQSARLKTPCKRARTDINIINVNLKCLQQRLYESSNLVSSMCCMSADNTLAYICTYITCIHRDWQTYTRVHQHGDNVEQQTTPQQQQQQHIKTIRVKSQQ